VEAALRTDLALALARVDDNNTTSITVMGKNESV
jgi:hypothetical protein